MVIFVIFAMTAMYMRTPLNCYKVATNVLPQILRYLYKCLDILLQNIILEFKKKILPTILIKISRYY